MRQPRAAWRCLLLAVLLLAGCADTASQARGVFLLIGTAGAGPQDIAAVRTAANVILSELTYGDFFAVGRIDTPHFSPRDVLAAVRFNRRPTVANGQKRLLQHQIGQFLDNNGEAPGIDMTGGLLAAVEFLKETGVPFRYIVIASDLGPEDDGAGGSDFPIQAEGCTVLSLIFPDEAEGGGDGGSEAGTATARLGFWQRRIASGGGSWQAVTHPNQLAGLLSR